MKVTDYILKSLTSIGLSEGEAVAYLYFYQFPDTNAGDLAYRKGLSLSGAYKIVHGLLDKNLIEVNENGRPFAFRAVPLKKLIQRLEKQGRSYQRMAQEIKYLASLEKLPHETTFIPKTHLSDFYLKILSEMDGSMSFMATYESILSLIGEDLVNAFVRERVKKGIRADGVMFQKTSLCEELGKRNWKEKREFFYFPIQNYPEEFTYIYRDTVANFYRGSDGKVHVVTLHSPAVARARCMHIQAMWNSTQE